MTMVLTATFQILDLNAQIREKDNLRQVDQVNTDILIKDKQLLQKEIGILREQLVRLVVFLSHFTIAQRIIDTPCHAEIL
jgi:hypothetical protein